MEQVIIQLRVHVYMSKNFQNQIISLRRWIQPHKHESRDKRNSEMSAEIRSGPSSPICIPRSAHQDYFYLSLWLISFFKVRMCQRSMSNPSWFFWQFPVERVRSFIPEGNRSTQEQMNISVRGRDQESNLWLKESSGSTHTHTHTSLQPSQTHSFASSCNYWHNHIMFHRRELRCSHSAGFIKAPSHKKFTLLRNIYSKELHLQSVCERARERESWRGNEVFIVWKITLTFFLCLRRLSGNPGARFHFNVGMRPENKQECCKFFRWQEDGAANSWRCVFTVSRAAQRCVSGGRWNACCTVPCLC